MWKNIGERRAGTPGADAPSGRYTRLAGTAIIEGQPGDAPGLAAARARTFMPYLSLSVSFGSLVADESPGAVLTRVGNASATSLKARENLLCYRELRSRGAAILNMARARRHRLEPGVNPSA